ncbi:hypothetical protein PIB30_006363 [Stylosanthes scabra]|uniref:Uncharacterized protein n=1 Tax=Stylosanthes scabra TaxID=79078 RepID=A0ABU6S3Q5_9FABA|nr:hypothetical protein [Stylosanthes scabra]
MLVDKRQGKSKKKGKKGSSSTSEPEYVDSSHESECEYEADSEQTMSQVVFQRPRRNDPASKRQPLPRRAIFRSKRQTHDCLGGVLANKKRKGLEEEGSKSKRPKKGIDVPRVDSANASLGDNESNAGSGNLHQENDEQPQQQPQQPPPQQSPPQEEEPPHYQPPPQQQQHQSSKSSRTFIIVHQHELIDISSGSEGEPEPTPS